MSTGYAADQRLAAARYPHSRSSETVPPAKDAGAYLRLQYDPPHELDHARPPEGADGEVIVFANRVFEDRAMAVECPQQYSVWENDKGGKIFVEEVYDEATDPEAELEQGDEPQFFVTVVPYADRYDMDAIAEELDAEQWAELIHVDGIRQTGVEPPEIG